MQPGTKAAAAQERPLSARPLITAPRGVEGADIDKSDDEISDGGGGGGSTSLGRSDENDSGLVRPSA